jgi:hypothetical protein
MGRTACTEPQCLYKGALYLTVELYLYSPYGSYGLYRASVPVQGCTLPLPVPYAYHLDTQYLNQQGCENPWLFFEAKRGQPEKKYIPFTVKILL